MTVKVKAFVSFDYEHDLELKNNLTSQSNHPKNPLKIEDFSILKPIDEGWKKEARNRIKKCDIVIFICGKHTDQAKGVNTEMTITRELMKPYILLRGRPNDTVKKPEGARASDEILKWKWKNLNKILLEKINKIA